MRRTVRTRIDTPVEFFIPGNGAQPRRHMRIFARKGHAMQTSALDHDTGRTVMALLRTMALSEERALVTHDARIFEFADRIALMNDGRIDKIVRSADELRAPCDIASVRGVG